VKILKGMTNLEKEVLIDAKVSEESLKDLKKALPKLTITR